MFKFPDTINKLRKSISNSGFDGFLVTNDYNRRYISGFSGSAGYLLITKKDSVLITDFRYIEQASIEAPGFEIIRMNHHTKWFSDLVRQLNCKSIGFESDDLTVNSFTKIKEEILQGKLQITLEPTIDYIFNIRAIKSEHELNLLKKAIDISDKAFNNVYKNISPGSSEEQLAWLFEKSVRELGGEAISFDTIVASGSNAARPHHRAGSDLLKERETIVIDCGARFEGYCSDLTRTVIMGHPDKFTKNIYEIVLTAQETAIELIETGMTGEECDSLARNVIREAGYDKNFGHSLGHGVGLQVHELPTIGPKSTLKIEDSMVFTIEPGIYIEGWGGVRIEDIVVMENGKAKLLSNASKSRY